MSTVEEQIRERFRLLRPVMDEQMVRLWVAAEARSLGRGGPAMVTRATGVRGKRITAGMGDLEEIELKGVTMPNRIRRPGAGRPPITETDPGLEAALEQLIDPVTRGEPDSPLLWTAKSLRTLAAELTEAGHPISASKVGQLLRGMGYSLQANQKTREGSKHPDRNAQFEYIYGQVKAFQKAGQPVVSVDTKKKELIGDFKNGGQEWHPAGQPEPVRVHDFIDRELGKVAPYGVYDITRNEGWVSVGVSADTSEFAVSAIGSWWVAMGKPAYENATDLLITADNGGSNAPRTRLWHTELQKLANETGLTITVCHFPPGTSKWNKIEHRMFSHISQNWRGRPLVSHEVVVSLIANTTTSTGLQVKAKLDTSVYEKGIKVSDDEMEALCRSRHLFHGDWNYTINPKAAQH